MLLSGVREPLTGVPAALPGVHASLSGVCASLSGVVASSPPSSRIDFGLCLDVRLREGLLGACVGGRERRRREWVRLGVVADL
ncbi:hypothetical protein E2C01_071420 [Portunus trituberculatus]|uniref:Uncharacterized protein n=1 Tax=Portunus trituberculatus TaxID=210409 RepID=A0A5B7I3X5_PORTR|nr:hypothetical protein [Portunus trituberculatus]